ncbi:MAG: hypothetical protein GWN67_22560 [Phycisphaerae bacterium]|nr:hypothetical protein [Phycisphaerae bacterium]NIU59062.1 hypothetical protein [Phycisphaerae bacterium]NIW80092.1 hypothetical protein [Calditrichia bacterium]NIW95372.1 hypothetical protein [Phycisphaerae bacterium]
MNNIQDKVMQANGINQNTVAERQLKGIQVLIKRETRRFLAAKFLTGLFWIASLIILGTYMFLVKSLLHSQREAIAESSLENSINYAVMALEIALPLAIIIAIVCSVLLYIRAKSVNLLQVHERLHNLEEMVKVLLSK